MKNNVGKWLGGRFAWAALIVPVAAIVGVVFWPHNSADNESPATAAPAATTPPVTSSTPSQAENGAVKDAAFKYYFSDERRALLQEVLDTEGKSYAHDLLAGNIPSGTRGWEKKTPAPTNGYGMLHSVPNDGTRGNKPYVEVMVKFVDGQVDLSGGVLSLFIIKDGVVYDLTGKYMLDAAQKLVTNTPVSYGWHRTSPDTDFVIGYRDISGIPDWDKPLVSGIRYEVISFESNNFDSPVTPEQIKTKDAEFIAQIKDLNLNGSDWK